MKWRHMEFRPLRRAVREVFAAKRMMQFAANHLSKRPAKICSRSSQEEISKALEVASAAEAVFESGFTEGFERFDALRAKYRNEPWYKDLHGNYTHFILPYTAAEARQKFKDSLPGTPFRYDPMPTLRAVKTPQLWILGEDDLEAPSAETSRRIKTLIAEGKPITLALFPHVEHGMTEYEVASNGERVSTRFAPGYFAMMRDYARDGRLSTSYGSSVVASTLP